MTMTRSHICGVEGPEAVISGELQFFISDKGGVPLSVGSGKVGYVQGVLVRKTHTRERTGSPQAKLQKNNNLLLLD